MARTSPALAGGRDAAGPWGSPDRLVIRYLDGSTTASPLSAALVAERRAGLRVLDRESIRTGRLLGALSTALDLTEGQLPGHAVRTCHLAMLLADRLGLPAVDRESLFFAALLKDAGCSSNAAAVSRIFGVDERALKGRHATLDRGKLAAVAFAMRNMPGTEPLPLRLRRLIAVGVRGARERRAIETIRCERGASIARKAGFGHAVANAILDLHEQWDGGGLPRGLRGPAIDPLARILAACQGLDVFVATAGRARALEVLAARRGTWYDPDVTETLLEACTRGLLDELTAPDLIGRTMALEPVERVRTSDDADVDRIAGAFADIVDAKSPFTGSHSRRVAEIAEALAARLGLPAAEVVDVRRAGLLHDLGKLGVPNMILDKPGRLDAAEMEVIRRHPELTLRILDQVPTFAAVAEIAACHHERLDGTGYFRGLGSQGLALGARIVAVADVFEALTADRPYRPAMSSEQALGVMRREVGRHLAADVVAALGDTIS
jgi:putative nucleotidyltransferase with HDIG domain